jgi:hypothetical protein
MPIAQSKRKLIAATALFVTIGALTGAIATGGATTISFATTAGGGGDAATGQGGGGGGGDAATGQGGGGGQGRTVQEGTVTSSPVPLPGLEGQQRATILPLTQDGSIYSGVLTYTASEPVNVVILNVQNLNETERAILNTTEDDGELGPLLTAQLDNQTSLAIAQITPDYGDSPAPSASIPFAGNAVWLHLAEDTPFVATYVVSAQTQQAETMNNISNLTATAEAEEAAADEEEAAADEEEAAADEEEAAADGGAANGNATNGGAANGNATNGDVDGA